MHYSININQIAIATHNETYNTHLDLIDGVILEYLQKQSISTFAKRNYIIHQGEIYYMICYDNIIKQLPLLNITSKEVIGRRLKKIAEYDIINKYVDRKNMNKTYFTTTELFETFFTYLPTQKLPPPDSKVVSLPTQKSDHIIDKNINDKNINDKKDTASGFSQNENSTVDNLSTVETDYSEIPNSPVSSKMEHTQKQKNEDFNKFWEEYGKKVKKPKAEESFKKALSKASFEEIMYGVKEYQRYLKVVNEKKQWLGKAEPHKWLNEIRWKDDYNDLIKDEYKKQGKPLPVAQKSPEKAQEEVKMKEHTRDKRKAIINRLNAKELEFTYFLRKHLINDFSNPVHSMWIENLVFSCKNGIALIEVESEIGIRLNWEKIERLLRIELQGKFEFTEIKWKLID